MTADPSPVQTGQSEKPYFIKYNFENCFSIKQISENT